MTKKDKPNTEELNVRLMNEIGLDVDKDGYIVDQDNLNKLLLSQKNLIKSNPDVRVAKGDVAFDPINNHNLSNKLLSYYIGKVAEEEPEKPDVSIFYQLPVNESGKGSMELRDTENNKITSKPYYNDSLKAIDLLFQMAGDTNVDLTEYDEKIERKPIARKPQGTGKRRTQKRQMK